MTSFAFILGVLPMVLAEGAGAEMRHALGAAVFSGMLGVTRVRRLPDPRLLGRHRVGRPGVDPGQPPRAAIWLDLLGLLIGGTISFFLHLLGRVAWPGMLVITATVALATFAAVNRLDRWLLAKREK